MTLSNSQPQDIEPLIVQVDGKALPVWPEGQPVQGRGDSVLAFTAFSDVADYHPQLIAEVLALEADPAFARMVSPSASGTKLHGVETWQSPAAVLLVERVRAFYRRVYKRPSAQVHVSWANVSKRGDYSMAHSHPDCKAVAVYMLEPGEANPADPMEGLLAFIDPRYAACCRTHEGFMTTPYSPKMGPGSLVIFPSQLVHSVNPYGGGRPRITFSFDLDDEAKGPARVYDELAGRSGVPDLA